MQCLGRQQAHCVGKQETVQGSDQTLHSRWRWASQDTPFGTVLRILLIAVVQACPASSEAQAGYSSAMLRHLVVLEAR